MNVEPAGSEDLDRIVTLNAEVHELHVAWAPRDYRPHDAERVKDWLLRLSSDNAARILVARENGEVIGYAVCLIRETPENPFRPVRRFLYLDQLSVAAAHRRRGVGTALLGAVGEIARREGAAGIELDLWTANEAAKAFYRCHGFSPCIERWAARLA